MKSSTTLALLREALLTFVVSIVLFGPISGLVLDGFSFTNQLGRAVMLAAIVTAGRVLISLIRMSALGAHLAKMVANNGTGVTVMTGKEKSPALIFVALFLAGLCLPFFTDKYLLGIAILALIYCLLGLGLNIVVGVQAVIGHFCSSGTIPASEIYNDAGIIEMTPSSTNPVVTDRGFDNLFRGCGRDDQQAVVAGAFILDTLKRDKIALIHDKDTYGQGLVDAVKKTLEDRGVKPVLYEGLTRGERDFNALVTKIKSTGANAVYFGGLIPEGGPLIRQLKEQGVDVVFVSGDSFAQKELIAAVGGPANLANVYYSATPDPLEDPSTKGVQDNLKKANITPANYTLYGYANAQAIVAALKAGEDLASQAAYLRNNVVDTAIGKLTWDEKGDIKDFKFVFYNFDDKGTPTLVK